MIDFLNISKHFGTQDILVDTSFRINKGERVGIVGPNGAGKSTIFRLVTGEILPDGGNIVLPSNTRLGHLLQQLNAHEVTGSLLEYTVNAIPELSTIHLQIERIELRIQESSDNRDGLLQQLGILQTQFEHLGGYEIETRAEKALSGLGFQAHEFNRPFSSFSGGWQMRAELARTLIAHPDILLLDEPSNYLDLPAVEWLKGYLRDFDGTMLLISHDRYLLESLTNITLECAGGIITRYVGNYSFYIRERQSRLEQLEAAKQNQDRKKEQIGRFVERFRAKNTKATQVQSRLKQLEKMEDINLPRAPMSLSGIRIPDPPHSGTETAACDDVGFFYNPEHWIFRNVDLQLKRGDKVALVGYNGMGKTTILRLLAGVTHPAEGTLRLGHKVIIGYQSQEFAETMAPDQSLFNVIKDANGNASDATIRNLLGSFGFGGDAMLKTVNVLSGGEKIRLAFARIFINPPNFLILDEPTTHLDIEAREALEMALKSFSGTVCFVSHDVEFVRRVAESILAITEQGVVRYAGDYDYYREKASAQSDASSGDNASQMADHKKRSRQERAAQREAGRRTMLELRKRVRINENLIEALECEQNDLVNALAQGSVANYSEMNRRLKTIQAELESLTEQWEKDSIALETIEENTSKYA